MPPMAIELDQLKAGARGVFIFGVHRMQFRIL
jgi:hypothetical protein